MSKTFSQDLDMHHCPIKWSDTFWPSWSPLLHKGRYMNGARSQAAAALMLRFTQFAFSIDKKGVWPHKPLFIFFYYTVYLMLYILWRLSESMLGWWILSRCWKESPGFVPTKQPSEVLVLVAVCTEPSVRHTHMKSQEVCTKRPCHRPWS